MSVKRFSSVGSYTHTHECVHTHARAHTHTELETKVRKLLMCLQNDISSFTVRLLKTYLKRTYTKSTYKPIKVFTAENSG